jgi:hypothetical protein
MDVGAKGNYSGAREAARNTVSGVSSWQGAIVRGLLNITINLRIKHQRAEPRNLFEMGVEGK